MNKKFFNYSKIIFQRPEVPRQGAEKRRPVDVEISRRQEKAKDHVEKRKQRMDELAKRVKKYKKNLLENWIQNNPNNEIEVHEAAPGALALRQIGDKKRAVEMYLLLSFVEKIWNLQKAYSIYLKCRKRRKAGKDVNFTPIEKLFSKDNAKRLGIGFFYEKGKWWAYDTDGSHEPGENYMVDSLSLFEKEFVRDKAKDSGMLSAEKKGSEYYKMMQKLPIEAASLIENKDKKRKKLIKWIKKNAQKKWKGLPDDMRTIASVIYGYEYGGKYVYRYFPKSKIVIAVKLENATLHDPDDSGLAFYLNEKNMFKDINKITEKDKLRDKLKEVIDDMSSEEVLTELIAIRDERGEALPEREIVSLARKIVGKHNTSFNEKRVSYADIRNGKFENVLRKKIQKQLQKNIEKKESVEKYSKIAAAEYMKEINSKIESISNIDKILQKTKPENLKFNINFDTKGNISSIDITGKATSILQEITKSKDTIENKIKNVRNSIDGKIKSIFPGFLGGIVAWIAQSFFSDEDLGKWIKSGGKRGGLTGYILNNWLGFGGAGAGVIASGFLFRAKKMNAREFNSHLNKLIEKERTGRAAELKKGIKLKEDTVLTGKEIIIPSSVAGKFKPERAEGFSFLVNGKRKEWEPRKKEKKGKVTGLSFLSGIFGRQEEKIKGEVRLTKATKIPKGTYIPKKSKISRII
jgi:hypothetical protein